MHDNSYQTSYIGDVYGSYISDSPREYHNDEYIHTPDDVSIDIIESDHINKDLLENNFGELFRSSSLSKIPIMEQISFGEFDDMCSGRNFIPILDVQTTMKKPYLLLEFFACLSINMILSSNALMYALVLFRSHEDIGVIIPYVFSKAINLACLGIFSYIFTAPDTYKSINLTIEYLMINAIVYEYSFVHILKYLAIQFIAATVAAFVSIGTYYDLIEDIPITLILGSVFSSSRSYRFSYSYVLVALMMHISLSIGLTILTNMTTSINSRRVAIQKAVLIFFVSLTFGAVIGPIGYVWPNLVLYVVIIISRNDYALFDSSLFATYAAVLIAIIIIYPIVAIQIKFVWRNKYRRYIEY